MDQLSLRNNRWKFKTSGKPPIILKRIYGIFIEHTSQPTGGFQGLVLSSPRWPHPSPGGPRTGWASWASVGWAGVVCRVCHSLHILLTYSSPQICLIMMRLGLLKVCGCSFSSFFMFSNVYDLHILHNKTCIALVNLLLCH